MSTTELDFTAEEVNWLKKQMLSRSLATDKEYYTRCHRLVLDFLDGNPMNETATRWLWGIKADCREGVGE